MSIRKWDQETWNQAMPEVPETVNHAITKALDIVRTQAEGAASSVRPDTDCLTADVPTDAKPFVRPDTARRHSFRASRRKVILAVSLAAAVLGSTAFAAGQFWNGKTLELFQDPSVEIRQKAMENGVASAPGCSVTVNGITVTVVQAVQDKNRVYLLLKVETEDPIIDAGSCFGSCRVETDDDSHPFHWHMTSIDQTNGKWEKEGYWLIDCATAYKDWQGGSVKVTLKDFNYHANKEASDDKLSAEQKQNNAYSVIGDWIFSIPLQDVSSQYKIIPVMQELKWGDSEYFIHSVTISPISLIIQYDIVAEGNSREVYFNPSDITLIDKSGSSANGFSLQRILSQHPGECLIIVPPISIGYEEDGHWNAMIGLQQIVDIDDLSEIVINCGEEIRIPLEDK